MIIEAKIEYVEATFQIFRCIGRAFDLFVKESGVKAMLLSQHAMPAELMALDWCWENEMNISKLLGFFINDCIPSGKMVQHLTGILEHQL